MKKFWIQLSLSICGLLIALCSCTSMEPSKPLVIAISGVHEPGQVGSEAGLIAKVNIQNPNAHPVDITRLTADLQLESGAPVGKGAIRTKQVLEANAGVLLNVPIALGDLSVIRLGMGLFGDPYRQMDAVLRLRLDASGFQESVHEWRGLITIPRIR
jgi:LEA14-like dessication related protein